MAQVSKPFSFTAGTTINDNEVDDNFDTLYTLVNGNLDTANLSGSAGITNAQLADIAPSKVLDHADSETEYLTGTTPGTTASLSRPSSLEGELERIRYRYQANNHTLFAQYMDSSGVAQSLGWVEPYITGPNLLPNSGFETKTSATATVAPDGWTATGTPTGLTIVTTAENTVGVNKRALLVATDAANEGLEITVAGLKSSTKYLIGIAYVRVSGTVALQTTGNASGAYQNLNLTAASGTSIAYLQGAVTTDTSGNNLVVKILNTAAGANTFRVYQCWMYEMRDQTTFNLPDIPMQTATYSTADDVLTNSGAGAWSTRTALSLSQYIPSRGYRVTYEVTLCFRGETTSTSDDTYEYAFRIQMDGSTVEGPYGARHKFSAPDAFAGGTVTLKYVVENLAPGATYAFTTDVYTIGSSDQVNTIIFNPSIGSSSLATQSQARLVVERI